MSRHVRARIRAIARTETSHGSALWLRARWRGALKTAGVAIAAGAMAFGTGGVVAGLAMSPVALAVASRRKATTRIEELEHSFPEAVRAMADALRAGGNVQVALARAAEEAAPAMRDELRRVASELEVGVPIEVALDEMAERCRVPGARVLAIALTSAVRSGADARPVLECIVDAATDRRRLRRELRASTAQGRMTALVIGALPGAFLLIMGAGGGSELRFLFREPLGWAILGTGIALEAAGFGWMRKLGSLS